MYFIPIFIEKIIVENKNFFVKNKIESVEDYIQANATAFARLIALESYSQETQDKISQDLKDQIQASGRYGLLQRGARAGGQVQVPQFIIFMH